MTSIPGRNLKKPNRRRHDRRGIDAPARLIVGPTVISGRIENIGPGGAAFITSEIDLAIRVGTQVSLVAPGAGDGGKDLELRGRVVRTDDLCDVSGESRSYGLVFDAAVGG